jgi:hypothetical protein
MTEFEWVGRGVKIECKKQSLRDEKIKPVSNKR